MFLAHILQIIWFSLTLSSANREYILTNQEYNRHTFITLPNLSSRMYLCMNVWIDIVYKLHDEACTSRHHTHLIWNKKSIRNVSICFNFSFYDIYWWDILFIVFTIHVSSIQDDKQKSFIRTHTQNNKNKKWPKEFTYRLYFRLVCRRKMYFEYGRNAMNKI